MTYTDNEIETMITELFKTDIQELKLLKKEKSKKEEYDLNYYLILLVIFKLNNRYTQTYRKYRSSIESQFKINTNLIYKLINSNEMLEINHSNNIESVKHSMLKLLK